MDCLNKTVSTCCQFAISTSYLKSYTGQIEQET